LLPITPLIWAYGRALEREEVDFVGESLGDARVDDFTRPALNYEDPRSF